MTIPTALITGIGGQDGAYLSQLLVAKGYRVAGFDIPGHKLQTPPDGKDIRGQVRTYDVNITNAGAVSQLLSEVKPTEVYHLASYSHVGESFELDHEVQTVNVGGTEIMLDAVLALPEDDRPRIYSACSSEVFGTAPGVTETSVFNPQNPYGRSKAEAYLYGRAIREEHGLHLSHGFMFNHESPLRSETFVTRKLTKAAAGASKRIGPSVPVGNLSAARDWGHARDYVEAMWLMLQQVEPEDYIIASGIPRPVRSLAETAYAKAGITLRWEGEGESEKAFDTATGRQLIHVDPGFFRPVDLEVAYGNAEKARQKLGWQPKISFEELVSEMVAFDCEQLETKAVAQA